LAKSSISSAPDCITLDRAKIAELHPGMARRVMRMAIEKVRGSLTDVTLGAVDSALGRSRRGDRYSVTLPGADVTIRGDEGLVQIVQVNPPAVALPIEDALNAPGCTDSTAFRGRFQLGREPATPGSIPAGSRFEAVLDADAIRGQMVVRNRRQGDRIQPLG